MGELVESFAILLLVLLFRLGSGAWYLSMGSLDGESGVNSRVATTVCAAGVEKGALMWFSLPTEVVSQQVISGICK
jgi:hypothetical protein